MSTDQQTKQEAGTIPVRLELGAAAVRRCLGQLGESPGVYRMLNDERDVLYVGKAKNLKKRVTAYTKPHRQPVRIQRMIAQTADMEFVTTRTEAEALLLENNLIKRLKPRYNVLLRDDKTFPDILIRNDHDFPRVEKHRGARKAKGDYYGPFASVPAVNRSIATLQRAFLLRTCSDGVFSGRTRPCLQYQIKRCSAPCVGHVSKETYQNMVAQAEAFLSGRNRALQEQLAVEMQQASESLDFEKAAEIRDRIRAMARLQARQDINAEGIGDADVIALFAQGGQACIQSFFFRGGRNNGGRAWFPAHSREEEPDRIMAAFIGQFYDSRPPPPLLLCSHEPEERGLLEQAFSDRAGRRVRIAVPQRGDKRRVMEHALHNARDALGRRLSENSAWNKLVSALARAVGLDGLPERIEVYDNSHIQGADAVGAMIVAGPEGLVKNAYRKFNIRTTGQMAGEYGGDDYAMMREVLHRRFSRALKEDPDRSSGQWPDLVLVDGGEGQLSAALEVFADLGLEDEILAVGVAKGPEREAGRERIHLPGRKSFLLPPHSPALYCIQRLRDEAHRFAIGAHRMRRTGHMARNPLDNIPGVGRRRRKALLLYFGSAKAVAEAGVEDLQKVEGVSIALARRIYEFFHTEG